MIHAPDDLCLIRGRSSPVSTHSSSSFIAAGPMLCSRMGPQVSVCFALNSDISSAAFPPSLPSNSSLFRVRTSSFKRNLSPVQSRCSSFARLKRKYRLASPSPTTNPRRISFRALGIWNMLETLLVSVTGLHQRWYPRDLERFYFINDLRLRVRLCCGTIGFIRRWSIFVLIWNLA
jgi:hypothetical protein